MEGHVSLYHWVAAALARGKAGIPEGTDQAIADPAIRALRDRIEVTNDPAVPHDGADVTVRLTNGARAVRRVRACIGSRGRPMTNAELNQNSPRQRKARCHNLRSMPISRPFAASRSWAIAHSGWQFAYSMTRRVRAKHQLHLMVRLRLVIHQ